MAHPSRGPEPTTNWQIITGILAVVFVALAIIAVLAVLGGGSGDASPAPSGSQSLPGSPSPATTSPTTTEPSTGAPTAPSTAPSVEPSVAASGQPSPGASPSPGVSPPPGASASPEAAGCSGSDANKAFFAQASAALSFETYCAALPSGWNLTSGSYRGADGGRLDILYKGPGGATLHLRQGPAACVGDPACPPTGTDLGEATFGDRPGAFLSTGAGLAVDASEASVVYLAETTGLDEAAARALIAALIPIR